MIHLALSALCLALSVLHLSIGEYGWATAQALLAILNALLYMRSI
jgi:hypothetical protein